MMKYAIEAEGLTKQYGNFTLDQVSFQVPAGSIVGFIGENGSGKTTTIKALLNLIQTDGGEVKILGERKIVENKALKEEIGVVFDENCFPELLSLTEINRVMKRLYQGWEEEKFFAYAEKFQLPPKKKIKEFSRGMKMKLSLATALSHHARILILDEATGGLDPVVRNEILDIFMEFIQDEEHTIFLSSHITSDIEKISDYILLIHEGKILFMENKDDLIYNYGLVHLSESQYQALDPGKIIGSRKSRFGVEALVKNRRELLKERPDLTVDQVSIEDILLYIVKNQETERR